MQQHVLGVLLLLECTGTLSMDLYYLAVLTHFDASNNSFVGTIPAAIG
jgi:hypothetical protein